MKLSMKLFMLSLLFICTTSYSQVGSDKAIFVEVFGTNIFKIDENGGSNYKRQNDLILYCQTHGITSLILYKLKDYPNSSFSKTTINYTVTAAQAAAEQELGNFIIQARNAGVKWVAAMGSPVISANTGTKFFDNINQFNKRMKIIHGNEQACLDMGYIESDWWYGDNNPDPNIDYQQYFRPGLVNLDLAVQASKVVSNGFRPLISGTYIGNLNTLAMSASNLANDLDTYLDVFYVHIYFPGFPKTGSNNDITDPNPFFIFDKSNGERFINLSSNSDPTIIIPLFSSEASLLSGSQFLGDNLKNENGFYFSSQGGIGYSLDDIKDRFELDYNTKINPYAEATGPHLTQTMSTIISSTSTPNIMNEGVGWFKYGNSA